MSFYIHVNWGPPSIEQEELCTGEGTPSHLREITMAPMLSEQFNSGSTNVKPSKFWHMQCWLSLPLTVRVTVDSSDCPPSVLTVILKATIPGGNPSTEMAISGPGPPEMRQT